MPVLELNRKDKPTLSYVHTKATRDGLPYVLFCGGFRSDMQGTKASWLETQCLNRGQGYVRFDYTGHGISGGDFEEGTISGWTQDAADILNTIIPDHVPVIVVGSSMGGWIALRLALQNPERIRGVIGIAAAPDFTREIKDGMSDQQKQKIANSGRLAVDNDYSDEPYVFTRTLIEDGEECCLLDHPLEIGALVVLLQGMKDEDVAYQKAFRIAEKLPQGNCDIILIEDGDHRLSRPQDLEKIDQAINALSTGKRIDQTVSCRFIAA